MPSPFLHLAVAARCADRLGLPAAQRPAFLFGSIAADARLVTGQARSETHFWDARTDVSGTLKLVAAHPHLEAARLSAVERAFVAGYLCHLAADEQWTFRIYRPYFGRYSPYGGTVEGAELQWALHAALETAQEARPPGSRRLVEPLRRAGGLALAEGLLPFLPPTALHRWRGAVLALAALPPGPARFWYLESLKPRTLAVTAGAAGAAVTAGAAGAAEDARQGARGAAFAARLPELQARASAYVAPDGLAEFDQRAVEASALMGEDYLCGRPLRPPGTEGSAIT
jgi:hypothetical protein